jgi:type IV pilus assembly protein PilF
VTAGRLFRSFLALVAAAWLFSGCGAPNESKKKEADARTKMGVTYLQQNNIPKAMTELMKASELDPSNAEVDMMLGLAYRARGDQKKAEEHLRNAIGKKDDYADAHNNLGIVLADRQAWDEAIREFEKAAGDVRYQTPEWAVYNAAEAYRHKGDASKAEEQYRKALRINERYAPAYTGLSSLLFKAGRKGEAEAVLTQCVKVAPDYVDGWMELGRTYAATKRPAEAAKAFKTVLSLSNDPEVRKQAANYLRIVGSERQ